MTQVATDALEVLAPASADVRFRGEVLTILPVSVGVIPQLVRLLRPVLASLDTNPADAAGIEITSDLVMELVVDHAPALFEATALCAGKPRGYIEGADPADFIALALKVVEVNRDFFIQRIAPLLGGLLAAVRGAGRTPSSS